MSDMHFDCPKCGHSLVVDESGAGLSVPCPECSYVIKIPAATNNNKVVKTALKRRPARRKSTSDQDNVRYCPNGHGLLDKWEGCARCFVCGWPQNNIHMLNRNIECTQCGKQISEKSINCQYCGSPLEKKLEINLDLLFGSVKCPVCGSRCVMEINAITGTLLGGLCGASKRHRCNSCRHLF